MFKNLKGINYKNVLIIILGNFLVAFAISFCFLRQNGNEILTGGSAGLSVMLSFIFPSINHEIVITCITWVLFFIGLIFLGKKFAMKTLLSTIILPLFLFIFSNFSFISNQFAELDALYASIIGGAFVGCGCGIIYRIGGSTGGFDIPPLIIYKYTKIRLHILFFIQDGILVLLAYFALSTANVSDTLNRIAVGLISVFVCTQFIKYTELTGQRSYAAEIVTMKHEEITAEIFMQLERGVTLVDVVGGYTNVQKKMIKVVIAKNQYHELMALVSSIDKEAFMILNETHKIFGRGFRIYK